LPDSGWADNNSVGIERPVLSVDGYARLWPVRDPGVPTATAATRLLRTLDRVVSPTARGRSEKSGTPASPSREGLQRGSNTAVEWKALQFHRTLFVRSNPDQDKQSTELRNAGGFAERNAGAEIAETRM